MNTKVTKSLVVPKKNWQVLSDVCFHGLFECRPGLQSAKASAQQFSSCSKILCCFCKNRLTWLLPWEIEQMQQCGICWGEGEVWQAARSTG